MGKNFLSPNQKHLIGIYGGVGPLAHIEFEKLLLSENYKRGARSDQDHPVWVAVSASSTPDRTQGLLHNKDSANDHLLHFCKLIEKTEVACIFVICNTAHGYYQEVQKELSIPWINLMHITAQAIKIQYPDITKVGILGTDATVKLGLYHGALSDNGLFPISPEVGSKEQQLVMNSIYHPDYGVKSTGSTVSQQAVDNLIHTAEWCKAKGAQAIIAACTEISVALTSENFQDIPIVDPLKIAANCALDIAFGLIKPEEFMLN